MNVERNRRAGSAWPRAPRVAAACRSFAVAGVIASLLAIATAPLAARAAEPPIPTTYRNLFVEAGHTPADVRAKIDGAYRQLFHGDPASEAVYFADGENDQGPLAYILDVGHDDVRSEGMSYGMMIAVQFDKQREFDALWNWAKSRMQHNDPKHPAFGFFSWSVKRDGAPNDEMPAADGEEYFIAALYFASHRWGDREGIYDYGAEADRLLTAVRHRETITGPTNFGAKRTMTAGALFHSELAMVRFTPDAANSEHTDPSYHLPAFYELWARWGPPEDREFWKRAATVSRDFFENAAHPKTGLAPEYAEFEGRPWAAPWNPDSPHFFADSWRTAMNWSVDWSWWQADPRARERSDRVQAFFESQGLDSYGGKYALDGEKLSEAHNLGLVATNATAGLAATDRERALRFANKLWQSEPPTGQWRYYDGMLYLMSLLHCAGEFRVWAP